jgi:hypothetical protein
MSPDGDALVEERIRAALNEVAERVTFAGDLEVLGPETPPARHRGPARRLAVVGIAAACVVALAVGVGVAVQRGSSGSPGASVAPTSASTAPTSTTPPTTSDPVGVAALAAWAKFPAQEHPRPLVLLEGLVNAPASGFTASDISVADNDKEAFDAGAITTPGSLPSGPPNAGGYPIINAASALDRIRESGSGTASTVVTTTGVRLGTASFLTDRGTVELPAWLVSFRGVTDPAQVLAVDPALLFPAPDPAAVATIGAASTPDPRTLTLTFPGARAGTGPCTSDYHAHVTESAVAVAVAIDETPHGPSTTPCYLMAYSRQVTVTLSQPLGARVLVDEKRGNAPVSVAP